MSAFNILTGKLTGKRTLGRPRSRMGPKEVDVNTSNWVDLAQDMEYWRTFVNGTLNIQVP